MFSYCRFRRISLYKTTSMTYVYLPLTKYRWTKTIVCNVNNEKLSSKKFKVEHHTFILSQEYVKAATFTYNQNNVFRNKNFIFKNSSKLN